jgi:hypothetical protein
MINNTINDATSGNNTILAPMGNLLNNKEKSKNGLKFKKVLPNPPHNTSGTTNIASETHNQIF